MIRFTASTLLLLTLAAVGLAQTRDARIAEAAARHQIQTIYVMPSSHWDLGFIAPPEEVLPRLKPHIDEVIANAKRDPEFRWTIESVWQIREWLARTSDPHSATCQFFINTKDNASLDSRGPNHWGYSVFGLVTSGMDVVTGIEHVDTGEKNGMRDVPVEDVVIETIRRAD